MKKTISILFFIFTYLTIHAQTIDNTALQGYPNSVVLRVYNVVSKINLTPAEQTTLADLFQDEESELATLARNGATNAVIDSMKNIYKAEFNSLLSPTQLANFYKQSVAAKSNTTGRLMSIMLCHKYNVDTIMQQYFDSINIWREQAIEKIWLAEVDNTTRNNKLLNAMYLYDSLFSVYTNAASSGNYFASRVFYLDSIQHIDSSKKVSLGSTYFNYCTNFKNRAHADNFNAAFNTVFNNITDSSYYVFLYKNEIMKTAINNATNSVANYIKRDKISNYTAQLIAPILLQQERIKAIVNKIFPNYTVAKDSIIDTLTFAYQMQIDNLIVSGGSILNPSQIGIAIKYATELNLTEEQVNTLTIKLNELNGLINQFKIDNPESEYDSKSFESEILNDILSPEQYTQVLTLKFNAIAINLANTDWKELVRLVLSNQYNMTETKQELTNYHLAVLIAYYRNAHNPELQYSSVRSINQMMPEAMRTLLEIWEYRTPYTDTIDTFFQW